MEQQIRVNKPNKLVLQGRIWDVELLGGGVVETIRIQTEELEFLEQVQVGLVCVRLFKTIKERGR